jgi:hypothetical protein
LVMVQRQCIYKLSSQLYSWTTMFACDALHLLSNKEIGDILFFEDFFKRLWIREKRLYWT